jgi:dethiobiotin synthetase
MRRIPDIEPQVEEADPAGENRAWHRSRPCFPDGTLSAMIGKPPRGIFVTGTSTNVGKTYVAARIARDVVRAGRRVGVYKPVASGCRLLHGAWVSDDALALWEGAGRPGELAAVCPQCFAAPLAPHLAARAEHKEVDAELLRSGIQYWTERAEFLIVEGAGGLMSPVSEDDYVADLAAEFELPLVVVAANELGAINQTLQTLITAASFREGLPVAGIILNDCSPRSGDDLSTATNADELRQRCVPPLLACLTWQQEDFATKVDWWNLGTPAT